MFFGEDKLLFVVLCGKQYVVNYSCGQPTWEVRQHKGALEVCLNLFCPPFEVLLFSVLTSWQRSEYILSQL